MTESRAGLSSDEMAREVALDLRDGQYVNLGIGLPQLVADHIPLEREVVLHSENGVLGVGGKAEPGFEDWDLVDAGKKPVKLVKGGSYMSHADSFGLIRGKHLDVCVMGAFQVSATGDLANWWTGEDIPGVGGAMDLAKGARSVSVLMRHVANDGALKIVDACTYPLTGRSVVRRIYTNLGIFEPAGDSVIVRGLWKGIELAQVQELTGVPLSVRGDIDLLPRPLT
jgi:3-oxoadipate CoA-transferase beta subunit